nr:DUF4147 domain-containing protein [uncultured Cohaesibacter sp.]
MAEQQTDIQALRDLALKLFQVGVEAANPAHGLARTFEKHPLLPLEKGRYLIIALGKAANAMAETCLKGLPDGTPSKALVVTNYENARPIEGATCFAAAHPVPDEHGLAAGQAIIALLEGATAEDQVIVLISGGGSALVPAPIDGVSLEDKIAVNKLLLANGYAIHEMNLVRQTLSQLKGGGLSQLAHPAKVQSYILSDVVGDDLSTIASGPTSPPLGTAKDSLALFADKGLLDALPAAVRAALEAKASQQEDSAPADLSNSTNSLIGSNAISLDAILQALPAGWRGIIVDDLLEGDVEEVAPMLRNAATEAPTGHKTAYIWGGETTVTLKGDGKGGRNQELAARFAMAAEAEPITGRWVFLSGGTDGRDGPTDSAGGLVDQDSLARMRQEGADPAALLANNDSYKALKASRDHIEIGATGTNVADIQICLIDRS